MVPYVFVTATIAEPKVMTCVLSHPVSSRRRSVFAVEQSTSLFHFFPTHSKRYTPAVTPAPDFVVEGGWGVSSGRYHVYFTALSHPCALFGHRTGHVVKRIAAVSG